MFSAVATTAQAQTLSEVLLDEDSLEVRRNSGPRTKAYEIQANTTYVKSGYTYKTDELARPISAEGVLVLQKSKRTAEQTKTGKLGNPGDEGGHLIGSRFNGPSDAFNLLPQTRALNRGAGSAWTQMERDWGKALEAGKTVEVHVQPVFDEDNETVRPDSFIVEYTIDEIPFEETFPNV